MTRLILGVLAFFLLALGISRCTSQPAKEDCHEFDYASSRGPCRLLWCDDGKHAGMTMLWCDVDGGSR